MVVSGLKKVIIFRYQIAPRSLHIVLLRFAEVLRSFPRQWCFGRRVSFSIMVDSEGPGGVIIEFENLNIFLSVESLREWFERIICEYRLFTKERLQNLMRFQFGSYHFIDRPKEREQSPFTVTTSFYDLETNPESVLNPKIGGIPVSIKCVPTDFVIPRCNENTVKFHLCFHFVH